MLTELERRQGEKERRTGGRKTDGGKSWRMSGKSNAPRAELSAGGSFSTPLRKSHCFKWNKNGTKLERVDEKNTTGVN